MPAPPPAPVPSAPHVGVGGGVLTMPAYPGSARIRVLPLPYLEVHAGPLYASSLRGVGLEIADGALYGGISVYVDLGRKQKSDPARLAGRRDIGIAADPRVYLGLRRSIGTAALVHVETSLHRHLGGSNAFLADASAGALFFPGRGWMLDATLSTTWMDRRYARAFFDSEGAGFRDVALSLFGAYAFSEHWSFGGVARLAVLVGEAGSSPVTAERLQPATATYLRYDF